MSAFLNPGARFRRMNLFYAPVLQAGLGLLELPSEVERPQPGLL
jgi:hypothetical protein